MSDDESARPAAELDPAPEAPPAPEAAPVAAAPNGDTPADTPAEAPAETSVDAPAEAAAPAPAPAPAEPAADTELLPVAVDPAPPVASGPTPSVTRDKAVAFVKTHAATLVLAVLLVAAIVWGALGVVSTNEWESRAHSLSSDLTTAEETIAEAEATIDDLETARSRAEATATACIGAIDDADAMLEVSAELDEKNLAYVEGLDDFLAAINAGDVAAVETIGAEMDRLIVQIEDLSTEISGHIDDYSDSAEGCHVDEAQDV
ncbi:hypothetical protein AB1046_21850 [Promicromonospora sp. Populi]|uniref:hypothetical protein n=1 Tax=Promicromonospora sp. Populi TaxID=3239420 RepID=UPI0034E2CBA7